LAAAELKRGFVLPAEEVVEAARRAEVTVGDLKEDRARARRLYLTGIS
jgi:hypothetical protein